VPLAGSGPPAAPATTLLADAFGPENAPRERTGRSGSGSLRTTFAVRNPYSPFKKMTKLRVEMDKKLRLKQKAAGADHSIRGGFVTSHDHASGAVVEILHLGCSVPKP